MQQIHELFHRLAILLQKENLLNHNDNIIKLHYWNCFRVYKCTVIQCQNNHSYEAYTDRSRRR